MNRWQLQDAKRRFSRLVDRRRLRSDGKEFKRFLIDGPDFDVLQIERARESARAVEPGQY